MDLPDPVNPKVTPKEGDNWTLTYATFNEMESPKAEVVPDGNGFILTFKAGRYNSKSERIPTKPEIKKQVVSANRKKFHVDVKYKDLNKYFPV